MTQVVAEPTARPDLSTVAAPPRPPRRANATLVARHDLSRTMARFRFRPDDGSSSFVAGQYRLIALAGGSTPPRPYSIASSPGSDDLDFVISLVADGALTPRLFAIRIGDRVSLGPPRGHFRLDDADERDHLLIGTGSGIAPLLSMIAVLRARPVPPRTVLLEGARVQEELAATDLTAGTNETWLSYRPTISRASPGVDWTGRQGRVGEHLAALIAERAIAPERTIAYLCGSPAMIDGCSIRLAELGLPPDAIRSERFVTM